MQTGQTAAQTTAYIPPKVKAEIEAKKTEKPYISYSQLNMYTTCAEAYYRRYIKGERIPPGFALLAGSGVHAGAEFNFRQKIESRQDLKENDVVDVSTTEFETRIAKDGVVLTEEESSVGFKKVKGQTKDRIVRLSKLFMTAVAPRYQPNFVEEKCRIVIPESKYDLLAILDLADESGILPDLKTSAKKKTQNDVDKSDQLTLYSLAHKRLTGKLPKGVRLELLIDRELKTKTVTEHQTLDSARTVEDMRTLVNRINAMIKGINQGVFMPCDRNHWKCNPRFCGYYETCKYVSRGGSK